jgi:hypothetical protein
MTRIDKTLATVRSGALPPPMSTRNMFAQSVTGAMCSGCNEPIERFHAYYSVRLQSDDGPSLRFHPVCHEIWVRFER